jgi:hypothetical protein
MLAWIVILAAVVLVVLALSAAGRRGPQFQDLEALDPERETDRKRWHRRVRRLSDQDRDGFLQVWHSLMQRYQNDPCAAVVYADLLISGLIQERCQRVSKEREGPEGYLDRPLRDKYHIAHQIAVHDKRGPVLPDDLNRAMELYAAVFDELLADSDTGDRRRKASESTPNR